MSLENGWINEYSVVDSEVMECGDMICDKCGKEIKGLYLVRDRTNFKHRGNETDERYIYHRECRKNKALDEYEKAVKKAGVVEQSEQLVCDCVIPKPKDAYIVPDKYYCRECNGRIVN